MSLFHGKNVQLGYIVGKALQSNSCTASTAIGLQKL